MNTNEIITAAVRQGFSQGDKQRNRLVLSRNTHEILAIRTHPHDPNIPLEVSYFRTVRTPEDLQAVLALPAAPREFSTAEFTP